MVASRYTPLLGGLMDTTEATTASKRDMLAISSAEADQVLDSVLPRFQELRTAMMGSLLCEAENDRTDYTDAVVELVAAHLLELWAVQLVGSDNVGVTLGRCFPDGIR